mmetsp:Transcript_1369/g.4475  ORF Transcript_1369/g.4475 Transcript_1369/m.4475 type:complete len:241 (+) Transcript_1369:977-1699(+)
MLGLGKAAVGAVAKLGRRVHIEHVVVAATHVACRHLRTHHLVVALLGGSQARLGCARERRRRVLRLGPSAAALAKRDRRVHVHLEVDAVCHLATRHALAKLFLLLGLVGALAGGGLGRSCRNCLGGVAVARLAATARAEVCGLEVHHVNRTIAEVAVHHAFPELCGVLPRILGLLRVERRLHVQVSCGAADAFTKVGRLQIHSILGTAHLILLLHASAELVRSDTLGPCHVGGSLVERLV